MVQLSKYVRDHFSRAVKKVKERYPLLKYRLVTARAVKMLKEEEARLKEMAKDE